MLVSTCWNRTASHTTHTGSVLVVIRRSSVASSVKVLTTRRIDFFDVDRLPIQSELSGRDAFNVEQVIDQV